MKTIKLKEFLKDKKIIFIEASGDIIVNLMTDSGLYDIGYNTESLDHVSLEQRYDFTISGDELTLGKKKYLLNEMDYTYSDLPINNIF
jgi:hypothetical protein